MKIQLLTTALLILTGQLLYAQQDNIRVAIANIAQAAQGKVGLL